MRACAPELLTTMLCSDILRRALLFPLSLHSPNPHHFWKCFFKLSNESLEWREGQAGCFGEGATSSTQKTPPAAHRDVGCSISSASSSLQWLSLCQPVFSAAFVLCRGEATDWKWLQDFCYCAEKVAGVAKTAFIYYL